MLRLTIGVARSLCICGASSLTFRDDRPASPPFLKPNPRKISRLPGTYGRNKLRTVQLYLLTYNRRRRVTWSSLKPDTHYPYIRPVYTGRIYGPYIRVSKMTPVYTACTYGPRAIPDVIATQKNSKYDVIVIFTRDSVALVSICHGNSVCLSVRPSACHTGGSAKNG